MAITGLEEAEILLREDRTGKIRTLFRSLKPDVESLGLEREALAAYRRFAAAVERDTATVSMARELAKVIAPESGWTGRHRAEEVQITTVLA